ncbi:MAG: bifunctional metallophosphatase/5'-nucleotidase, partial [Deltaproteobacteria bacterium]|nr:bifunctional metallophosphatase/5'-nucleotidase [Deltaproteobacteria bacterium]
SGVDTRLTLLHTSDIHSRLFPFELSPSASDNNLGLQEANAPFGGAARLAYLVRRERERAARVLHLDSGDCFQGAPVFNLHMGEAEIRFLSTVGVDAAVIGNHEFDAGVPNFVEQLADWGAYDNLAANYIFPAPSDPSRHDLGAFTAPYVIYNLNGLRVGVIGMGNLGSLTSIGEGGNSLALTPLEQNETVRTYVRLLHPMVDLVVVLSHLGLSEDEDLIRGYEKVVWADRRPADWPLVADLGDGRVVAEVPGVSGIDIVVGGHLHVVLNPPKEVTDPDGRTVIIMHSGAFAKYLGRIDLVVQDDVESGGKRIVSHKYQVFPVDNRLAEHEDLQAAQMLQPYLLDLERAFDLRRVVAYAPLTITRYSQTGVGDSALGNLVTEAMRRRRRVEAEFSVTNTLGVRDNLYRGPINVEDLFNVFPFENTLTVMYLSGREVQEMVDFVSERSASRGCNSQAQVAGMSFTMNCAQVLVNEREPDSYQHPGEDIRINSAPLDLFRTYKVATNDYIAKGGSGFLVLKRNPTKIDTGLSLRDVLADYLATLPRCAAYELSTAQQCLNTDAASQATCHDVVDCRAYHDRFCAGLAPQVPAPCLGTNGVNDCTCSGGQVVAQGERCLGELAVRGAYADTPCAVAQEDGRIRRKVSEGLDTLPDDPDPEPQP